MIKNEATPDQLTDPIDLVNKIRSSSSFSASANDAKELVLELAGRLVLCDEATLAALQCDRDALIASIKLLSEANQTEALRTLLSQIDISRDDKGLLEVSINHGLGGDFSGTHRWIVDYNIVGQRLEMIKTVVLPYVVEHCQEKTLFYALKLYEANCLALNRPILNPFEIYDLIKSVREQGLSSLDDRNFSLPITEPKAIRIVLPNVIFKSLLRLAWLSQDYLFELHDRYSAEELISLLRTLDKVVPVYLIPTHLGYPMGGGESFMHQTCRILCEFGIECVWVSFQDPKTGWHQNNRLTHTPYYIDIRYDGGDCHKDIQLAVDHFGPDLIHAQGGTNDAAMDLAVKNRVTAMIGYHFWSGLIELGYTNNQHIMDNLGKHALYTPPIQKTDIVWKYVASEFMRDVYERLGGKENFNIIHPISDNAQFLAERDDFGLYVLQINVTLLKGGRIFLDCVKALGDQIPFMGIQNEPEQSKFFKELSREVSQYSKCKLNTYGNVREFYKTARLVIVPTLVDETFCRVAFEAAMNGIPVITTANGFLKSMLGDTGIYLGEDSTEWISTIRDLYYDVERLKHIGEQQQARVRSIFGNDFDVFIRSALHLIDNSANNNIGIYTVWADQGLGNLTHTYTQLLRSIGYKVHIFSFRPYAAKGGTLVMQKNQEDWSVPANADSVYYSHNYREEVTVNELAHFVLANKIRTLLVPEICWKPNWERLFALKEKVRKLSICNIPMIEIVIKNEIHYHNRLTSTLYCTRQTETSLNKAGVTNGAFLGHGFGRPLPANRLEKKRQRLMQQTKIRFLHIAGHNPKIRKNTPQVIEAFSKALAMRDDIELTITSMDPLPSYYSGELPDGITIIDRTLSRDEILDLYEEHDVSIQVSSHEGLGLGFYESISRSTPVISLDAPPHNEVILEGKTGWLILAYPMKVPDNNKAIVESWRFDIENLVNRIASLTRDEIMRVSISTEHTYKTRFDEVALLTRFLQTLPQQRMPNAAKFKFPKKRFWSARLRNIAEFIRHVKRRIVFKLRKITAIN
ncbi:MAG: glycosyltransferase family 4 protein [Holosporales bacterium]